MLCRRSLLLFFLFATATSQLINFPEETSDEDVRLAPRPQTKPHFHQQGFTHKRAEMVKKSSVVLNKLVYALHQAFQPEESQPQQMERRGQTEHQYWKCYFNAVSCFRR